LRALRMAMAVSFSFRVACLCFRLGYVRGCVLSVLSVLWCCLGLASQPNPRCSMPSSIPYFLLFLLDRKARSKSPHFSLNRN
jgi:hypothetical protein